jgi:hypothetical protein
VPVCLQVSNGVGTMVSLDCSLGTTYIPKSVQTVSGTTPAGLQPNALGRAGSDNAMCIPCFICTVFVK